MKGRFKKSLGFALIAALAWVPWLLLSAPVLGPGLRLGVFVTVAAAIYVFTIAAKPSRGFIAALATGAAVAGAFAVTPGTAAKLLAVAFIVALARSAFLYRRRPARALAVEAGLQVGGLLVAQALAGPSLLSGALALWGYLLIQSLFFLIAGVDERADTGVGDPFENARSQAMRLLDQTGA